MRKPLGGALYSLKGDQAVMSLGAQLRRTRIKRGHTQRDVAQAIGKSIAYVSEVEHGRRGHRMDPVVAVQWAEYLHMDSEQMFAQLQLGKTEISQWRVRHYLETSAWASKYMRAVRGLKKAQGETRELLSTLKHGTRERDVARSLHERIEAAITCLHVPRAAAETAEVSHG